MAEKSVSQTTDGTAAGPGAALPGGSTEADRAHALGTRLARRIFAARGNHTEAHLKEKELAAIIILGIELAEGKRDRPPAGEPVDIVKEYLKQEGR